MSAEKPTILVTGGAGYIGSHAVLALKTNDIATDTQPSTGAFPTLYPGSDTGMLMAWAWAMQRVLDAAAEVPSLDATRFAVNGFSRWGKAALLAGAFDERIALTVPSSSGLSGVGQYRYFYEDSADPKKANEKIGNALNYAPHWFTPRFREFEHQVQRLPFDQHEVMALVAPRPLFMTVSNFDYWNNPRGSARNLPATQIGKRLADAAIGNRQALELCGELELLHRQMVERALARGAVVDFFRVLLRIGDKLAEGVDRHRRAHHQHVGRAADHRDRREVLDRVVGHLAHRRVGGMGGDVADHQGVAVGHGARSGLGGDRSSSARQVFDHEALAHDPAQAVGDDAPDQIDAAAGRLRRDDFHRSAGVRRLRRDRRRETGRSRGHDKTDG